MEYYVKEVKWLSCLKWKGTQAPLYLSNWEIVNQLVIVIFVLLKWKSVKPDKKGQVLSKYLYDEKHLDFFWDYIESLMASYEFRQKPWLVQELWIAKGKLGLPNHIDKQGVHYKAFPTIKLWLWKSRCIISELDKTISMCLGETHCKTAWVMNMSTSEE